MFELEFEEAPVWTLLYRDLWGPVWPNMAAPPVWTLPALWWHHRRIKKHVDAAIQRQAEAAAPSQVTVNWTGPERPTIDKDLLRFQRQAGPGSKA